MTKRPFPVTSDFAGSSYDILAAEALALRLFRQSMEIAPNMPPIQKMEYASQARDNARALANL